MYQAAHQNDGFNALRLYWSKLNPAVCAMIPNQQNFTRHDERFNFLTNGLALLGYTSDVKNAPLFQPL